MAIDSMHSDFIGLAKQLTFFWLDSSMHKSRFYIGLKIKDIDRRINLIKLPKNIKRNPRSISERNTWKANEWRSYICSIIVWEFCIKFYQPIFYVIILNLSLKFGLLSVIVLSIYNKKKKS